jgi:hypothetical protein
MAIHGAVGFRANMLRMENGELIISSPLYHGFEWPEPVIWAECKKCPKDEDGHVISEEDCSCGIYSTLTLSVLDRYVDDAHYVPILVEALGWYWFHWKEPQWIDQPVDKQVRGLTSSGVQVIAVIGDHNPNPDSYPLLWIQALASYYSVPIIGIAEAKALAEWAWEQFIPKEDEHEPNIDPSLLVSKPLNP